MTLTWKYGVCCILLRNIYASGKLRRETITGNGATKILDFQYDQSGAPYSLTYTVGSSSTIYYYITNLQGDVMFMVDGEGNHVAAYTQQCHFTLAFMP